MKATTIALALAMAMGSAQARQLWVSPSGDDSASGSENAPWRGFTKVSQAIVAGDTVNVLAGLYDSANGGGTFAPPFLRGDAARWTVIRKAGEGTATLRGGADHVSVELELSNHVELRGLDLEAVELREASDIRLIDNRISTPIPMISSPGPAAGISGTGRWLWIEGNKFQTRTTAIDLYLLPCRSDEQRGIDHPDAAGIPAGVIVRRNFVWDIDGAGFRLQQDDSANFMDVDRTLIENNVIGYVLGMALELRGLKHATVRNNYFNSRQLSAGTTANPRAIPAVAFLSKTRTVFVNNILVPNCQGVEGCVTALFDSIPGRGPSRCSHNLVWDAAHPGTGLIVDRRDYGWEPGGFGANILGVDPKTGTDPRFGAGPWYQSYLQPLQGSPLIDAGWSQSSPAVDFEGKPRPLGAGSEIGPLETEPWADIALGSAQIQREGLRIRSTASGLVAWGTREARTLVVSGLDGRQLARLSSADGHFQWKAPHRGAVVARALDGRGQEIARSRFVLP